MYELTLTDLETGKQIKWTPVTEEQEMEIATILMGLVTCPAEDITPSTPFGESLTNGPRTTDILERKAS